MAKIHYSTKLLSDINCDFQRDSSFIAMYQAAFTLQ